MDGLISVVIPVYNVEKYLEECIESVLRQSYQNFEIILVDDGSTDRSGIICDTYAAQDKRIQVVHQKNGGLSVARNTGFERSSGEYIYFLDSDDWIVPETLAGLVNKLKEDDAEAVFFDAKSFLDGDETVKIEQRYIRKHMYLPADGYTVFGLLQRNKEYHSAVPLLCMRRSLLVENSLAFFPGILYEDMLFTYQVYCKVKRITYLNKALYHRRYRSNSIMTSRKSKKNFESACAVYKKVREFSQEENLLQESAVEKYISRCAFNGLNLYRNISKAEQRECRNAYRLLVKDILECDAFHDRALYMRCYGIIPWFVYKVWEKTFARLMR